MTIHQRRPPAGRASARNPGRGCVSGKGGGTLASQAPLWEADRRWNTAGMFCQGGFWVRAADSGRTTCAPGWFKYSSHNAHRSKLVWIGFQHWFAIREIDNIPFLSVWWIRDSSIWYSLLKS